MGQKSKALTTARPANTDAYLAADVVLGALEFPMVGRQGGTVLITTATLRIDVGSVPTGMANFRLHLYNVTPPSALADNAAWDLPAGDRASYIGYIDLGTPVDLGSTLFTQVDAVNKEVKLEAGSLFGYLVTTAGYTPAGNSEVYTVTLYSIPAE